MEYIQPILSLSGGVHTWFKDVLHFTDDDFEQFLAFTRETHKDMLCCSIWRDIDANYCLISSEQESTAIAILRSRSHQLFPKELPNETLQSALRSRLFICRESWRGGQKRLRAKAAAHASSAQREDSEELSQPAEGEMSTNHSDLRSHSAPSLKIVLKLPNSRDQLVRLSAGQHVDYIGDTSRIDRPETSIKRLLRSSEDNRANSWSLNSTRPSLSESELIELESSDNENGVQPTDKFTDSSKKPTTSLSADLAGDTEVSVADRPSQHKNSSANIDDGDTITVDVEGRKEIMLAEHLRKTGVMKRQRTSSSRHNTKRRRMYDKRETEASPQLDQFTTPNELANTLPPARPVPTTDTYPSLAQWATNNMDVLVPVASTLPEGYAISISDCEEAGSDKQEPQHNGAMKPYSPPPKSLSPNPALDRILSQLQDLPTPPASNHPHSVDREVHADPHCVHPVGANDAVGGQDTATTGAAAAERDESFRGDLEDAQAKVVQLEAKVKLLEEAQKPEALKVELLQQDLDEERKRHQQSIYDLQEKTRSLEQSEQAAGKLQTKILSLEESLSKSQVDLDTHKQEYKEDRARWHSNMNSLRSQITTMRIAGLDSNANQNQTAISSAKRDGENTAQEIVNLQAQVETATNRADRSEHAVQKLSNLYDDLVTRQHTLSLEHKDSIQLANKLIIRWQRFFADLVYVLFTLIEEDFSSRRLREIMRQQGINRKVVREIKVREAQWEPFVAAALQDRCMDDTTTYLAKMMDQHLPESSAEVLAQFEEAGR